MELAEENREHFFTLYFLWSNFFNICVISQCIVYWIHFQKIHTSTYQKSLLHTLLLRVFKIVESLQCILNTFISLNNFITYSVTQSKTSCINVRYDSQKRKRWLWSLLFHLFVFQNVAFVINVTAKYFPR